MNVLEHEEWAEGLPEILEPDPRASPVDLGQ